MVQHFFFKTYYYYVPSFLTVISFSSQKQQQQRLRLRRHQQQGLWILSSLVFLPLVSSSSSSNRFSFHPARQYTSNSSSNTATTATAFLFPWTRNHSKQQQSFSTATTKTTTTTIKSNSETVTKMSLAKLDSPSAQRNKEPIWQVLDSKFFSNIVSSSSSAATTTTTTTKNPLKVLEIAAGCGVHTEYFAASYQAKYNKNEYPTLEWYPTDPSAGSRASIQCYINDNPNMVETNIIKTPLSLTLNENGIQEEETKMALFSQNQNNDETTSSSSSSSSFDLIICINMIHISPWQATLGLMKLAGERLSNDHGVLYCYGPYKVGGTAVESNLNFDQSLKSRDPSWGVRDLEAVCEAAKAEGLELIERIEMPANNLSLFFQKKK